MVPLLPAAQMLQYSTDFERSSRQSTTLPVPVNDELFQDPVVEKLWQDMLDYLLQVLTAQQIRYDYREFLTLTLLFLGGGKKIIHSSRTNLSCTVDGESDLCTENIFIPAN